MTTADVVDRILEAPIAPSFTRIGCAVRSRLDHWTPLDSYDLDDRVVLITGATSGLGLAAAEALARVGAGVILLGRNPAKTEKVRAGLAERTGNSRLSTAVADMGDLDAVRRMAEGLLTDHPAIDTVLHNAGALSDTRVEAPDGTEATIASQVVGPFLLTTLLLDRLRAAAPGRVITMSSGGMYSTGLTVGSLEMGTEDYKGTEQYARAKRAQVTLNEMWAERQDAGQVVFHAVHPGWADTPGVEESLPMFRRIVGPLLRSPAEGADTMVWLTADDIALKSSGGFWLDRRPRPLHRLGKTKETDTPERRRQLWEWCVDRSGVDPETFGH